MNSEYDCIIIGAGISGLALARRLESFGYTVLVLEKSKGVGGRIATRRDGSATYDHGAQFYKVPNNIDTWDIDLLWTQASISHTWFQDDKSAFKCASNGMTRLAKHLAQPINILFEQRVLSIIEIADSGGRFQSVEILCESDRSFKAKSVFISAPLPQALEILKASRIEYSKDLELIEYAKALVGLFEVDDSVVLDQKLSYLQNVNDDIFSISNQLAKKASSTLAFTVVMQPKWSQKYFDNNEEDTLIELTKHFSDHLKNIDPSFNIKKQQLKKWRYSHPTSTYPHQHVQVGQYKSIFLLGDAFGGPSIYGAVSSADSIHVNPKSHSLQNQKS